MLRQVQTAIERDARIDLQLHAIGIEFHDGTLTLTGRVPDIAVKKQAARAAAGVAGVAAVVDRLQVGSGEPTGDGAIRDAVCKMLLRDIDFQNCAIHARASGRREMLREPRQDSCGDIEIAVADGAVTLSGQVISLSHKRMAGVLAWWARGCGDVVNDLAVVPAEEDTDDEVADALRLVYESDPHVHAEQIGIASRGHVVTLDGVVASAGERRRAEFDAWYLFAVTKVINRLEVR